MYEDIKHYYFIRNTIYVVFNDGKNISSSSLYLNHAHFCEKICQTGKHKKTISFPLVLDINKDNSVNFIIRQKKTSLLLSGFFLLFDAALIFMIIFFDIKSNILSLIFMCIMASFFVILTLLTIIETFRFKIQIAQSEIIITPIIGKKKLYRLSNIVNVTGTPSGAKIHFDDGKHINLHYTFKTNIEMFIDLFAEVSN